MITQSPDTDPESERVLVEALRALPVWRRLAQVDALHALCEAMALGELRRRDPEANERQLRERLLERRRRASGGARQGPAPDSGMTTPAP